jgi:putative DNA primase/helicase
LFTFLGDIRETGRIYLAEGFSTSASINEFTGKPCFVGFSAYNLPIVALTIRRAFPGAEIIIAADADEAGEKYAEEAARTVGGLIVYAGRAN